MTQVKDKSIKWDGRSRPSSDLYKTNYNKIFNINKEKTFHEMAMEGYEEEKKMYEEKDGTTQKTDRTTD